MAAVMVADSGNGKMMNPLVFSKGVGGIFVTRVAGPFFLTTFFTDLFSALTLMTSFPPDTTLVPGSNRTDFLAFRMTFPSSFTVKDFPSPPAVKTSFPLNDTLLPMMLIVVSGNDLEMDLAEMWFELALNESPEEPGMARITLHGRINATIIKTVNRGHRYSLLTDLI
jgi:hypothetical protein